MTVSAAAASSMQIRCNGRFSCNIDYLCSAIVSCAHAVYSTVQYIQYCSVLFSTARTLHSICATVHTAIHCDCSLVRRLHCYKLLLLRKLQDRALAEALAAVEQTSPSLSPVGSPQRKASAAAAPQQWETVSKRKTRKSKQGKDLEGAAADAATNAADSNGGTD
jgi:hypothetical protein